MIHARTPLRPGMTAIAAALALSSTPLLAQSTDSQATDTSAQAPVTVAPPPPVVTTTPDAAAPAASASTDLSAQAASPLATTTTAQPAATPSAPVAVEPAAPAVASTATATPTPVAPIVANDTPTAAAPVARSTSAAVATKAPRATSNWSKPVASKPVIASTPAPTPIVAPTPVAKATPPAPQPQPVAQSDYSEEMIAIGGASLLILAGGLFAYSRRRRDEDELLVEPVVAGHEDVMAPEPAFAPMPATMMASDTTTALPNGFDISRFGRHTQAAYRGPTPENPSLSLKKRLKHASFYDQRERMAAEGEIAPIASPVPAPVAQAARTQAERKTTDHITVRPSRPSRISFRPVFNN